MYKRSYASAPLAALIALSLFVLMTQLITHNQQKATPFKEAVPYSFIPTQPKQKEPKAKPEETKPELSEAKPFTRPTIDTLITNTPDIIYTPPSNNNQIENILEHMSTDITMAHGTGLILR